MKTIDSPKFINHICQSLFLQLMKFLPTFILSITALNDNTLTLLPKEISKQLSDIPSRIGLDLDCCLATFSIINLKAD